MDSLTRGRYWRVACIALALACVPVSPAMAHRVNLFAYVDGGRIVTESWFSKSSKVRAGIIEVFDAASGEKYLSGTTDDAGNFAFDIPPAARAKKADLRITLQAGEGHANQTTIKAEEYLNVPVSPSKPVTPTPAPAGPGSDAGNPTPPASSQASPPAPAPAAPAAVVAAPASPDPRLLAAMDAMLDAKLAPMKSMLAESQDPAPSMTEIIGGIGWIFGLVGVAAYFKGRRG